MQLRVTRSNDERKRSASVSRLARPGGPLYRCIACLATGNNRCAIGAGLGVGVGSTLSRFVAPLLFETRPTDAVNLAAPVACIVFATLLSSLPAVLRAIQIAPAQTLRHD